MELLKKTRAFTLIELSIVLVIIGLIIGGVLVGKDLIRAAELRSVVSELESFKTAVNAFKLKYNCLAGDCANASTFFAGAQNGNGDGFIQTTNSTADYEMFTFWKQLADAQLISGTYTGTAGPANTYHAVIGTNVPRSKFPNGGWGVSTGKWAPIAPTLFFPAAVKWAGSVLNFGAQHSSNLPHTPLLIGLDAKSIDTKLDDGNPGTGIVQSWINGNAYSPNCATGVTATAEYNSSSSVVCAIYFDPKF